MAQTIEAVFENGVLKPLQPIALEEGQRVRLFISQPQEPETTANLPLEQQMRQLGYQAFADVPDEEWEKISEGWKRD
jgi:predicted DNA-binding antitoxin AbrB/MazE fold protein